jgi:hypothetical protein
MTDLVALPWTIVVLLALEGNRMLGACRREVRCEVQGIGFVGKHGEIVG